MKDAPDRAPAPGRKRSAAYQRRRDLGQLLEAHGIVRVRETDHGRAYLELVKEEIVEGGLAWLQNSSTSAGTTDPTVNLLRAPGEFTNPEQTRAGAGDLGAADEIARSAILELRKELQRATRQDRPANPR